MPTLPGVTTATIYTAVMLELRRTVRFCLNDPGSEGTGASGDLPPLATPRRNGFSAWPAIRGLGRYYELHIRCRGEADPATGYFIDIKRIDEAVREDVLPDLESWITGPNHGGEVTLGEVMRRVFGRLDETFRDQLAEVALQLTPMVSLTIRSDDMDRVLIRQQYEFSAAHRLHVPTMSDEENRATFGKCNNPAGHGHNYRVEVAVWAPIDPRGQVISIEELDEVVERAVIEPLDHKNLNTDIPAFRTPGGVNPSVENIAKLVWEMLSPHLADAGPAAGAAIEEVSVWETEKTMCTYRGESAAVR